MYFIYIYIFFFQIDYYNSTPNLWNIWQMLNWSVQPVEPAFQGQVPFVFVGTVENIANAEILLNYNLDHLRVSSEMVW